MRQNPRPRASLWRVLLIVPIVAVLAVGWFNRTEPSLWGFPFFYWYQMLWVILCSALIGIIFVIEDARGPHEDDA